MKILVRKVKKSDVTKPWEVWDNPPGIWRARCPVCLNAGAQYWDYQAVLGWAIVHISLHHRALPKRSDGAKAAAASAFEKLFEEIAVYADGADGTSALESTLDDFQPLYDQVKGRS